MLQNEEEMSLEEKILSILQERKIPYFESRFIVF